MAALVDTPILGGGHTATADQLRAYLRRRNPALPEAELRDIVTAYWRWGKVYPIDPAAAFAQACLETNVFRFGGRIAASQHNPAGLAATNDGARGWTFGSWEAGVGAHFVHLLTWAGDERGVNDARRAQVQAAARVKGYAVRWRDLAGRWAVPGDGYADGIERHWQGIRGEERAMATIQRPAMIASPSPNHGYAGDYAPEAVVWHISEGSEESGVSWLTNPASNASSNYLIGRTGTIHELVNPEAGQQGAAWANGDVQHPDLSNPLIAAWVRDRINPNRRTISIELAGFTSRGNAGSLMIAQADALMRLTAWLCDRFGIAPDRDHILGHYQLNAVTRPDCPGFAPAEWAAWLRRVAALVAPPPAGGDAGTSVVWGIDATGVAELTIRFGGRAAVILGVDLADVGISIVGEDGRMYDRSIQAGAWGPWRMR